MIFRKYGKAIVAVIGAAATVGYGALSGDQRIEADEAVQIAIATATAVGVYLIPLAPQYPWAKTAVAVVLGVLQVLATLIIGGLDTNEWIALALATVTTLGVAVAPAVSDNGVANRPGPSSASTVGTAGPATDSGGPVGVTDG